MAGRKVIPFPNAEPKVPSLADLSFRVQSLAQADSQNIHASVPHFRKRMIERGITMRLVLEVLRHGNGHPEFDEFGNWRITMRRKVAGRRVHVVVAVCENCIECITTW
ncbi:MAG: DUF4258 domain-containing protein [Rhodobacteraceae bacterium]|nr:DUF4258 domain-containing protein [Paracoccaceae bacterium]